MKVRTDFEAQMEWNITNISMPALQRSSQFFIYIDYSFSSLPPFSLSLSLSLNLSFQFSEPSHHKFSQCINPRRHFFFFLSLFSRETNAKTPVLFSRLKDVEKKKRKERIWGSLIVQTSVSRWGNGVLCKPFFLISLYLFFLDVYIIALTFQPLSLSKSLLEFSYLFIESDEVLD